LGLLSVPLTIIIGTSPTEFPMHNSLQEFVDYVWSFYGSDDPLYPIHGLTKDAIVDAYDIYIERIEKGDLEYVHYSWGGGDSLDRERVRDIILEQPQFIGLSFN